MLVMCATIGDKASDNQVSFGVFLEVISPHQVHLRKYCFGIATLENIQRFFK
jgi:hypothetical protein